MKPKHTYLDIPRYKRWTKERDRALEQFHTNAQLQSSDEMRKLFTGVLLAAKSYFQDIKASASADHFDHFIRDQFKQTAVSLWEITIALRIRSYLLSKAAEGEILAQVTPKQFTTRISKYDLQSKKADMAAAGGPLINRISLYLDKLRRRIVSTVQVAAMNSETVDIFLLRVLQSFPKSRQVIRPDRILKPGLMEADDGFDDQNQIPWGMRGAVGSAQKGLGSAVDLIDEDAWNDMVDAYKAEFVPKWRSPEFVVDLPTKEKDAWYAWEFERDLTAEFVQSVRDGEIESAKENGIDDFVWIAIIDKATCDDCCGDYGCTDFDGLLISEISEMTGGEVTSCPAHFGCRCRLAPALENIPEKPDTEVHEFSDWLNT